MRVFLQAIFGQLLLNAFIIWRGYRVFPPRSIGRRLFFLFFMIELLLYFLGYFFYKDLPDGIFLPIMMVCNTWYIASIYIAIGLLVLDLARVTIRNFRKSGTNHESPLPQTPPKEENHSKVDLQFNFDYVDTPDVRQKQAVIAGCSLLRGNEANAISLHSPKRRIQFSIIVVFVAGLMIKGYHDAVYPVVRHLELHIPKSVEGRDSLTIVMMSDLHIGEAIGKKHVQRFVELSNAEQPDLVVIAGDILDYESRFAEKARIEEDLQRLNAPLGVYMTLGNHEYRANRFAKLRWIEKTGGILLVDSTVMPDSTFYLIGRDDATNLGRASLETLMQGVDSDKPVIVVDHQPIFAQDVINNQCDLGLFGHTHNGQYWPFPLLFKLVYEFSYGYFLRENTHLYVSSGIGFAGPPYRIGTRSEMVVIQLRIEN